MHDAAAGDKSAQEGGIPRRSATSLPQQISQMVAGGDQLVISLYDFQYERMIVKSIVSDLKKLGESWEANFLSENREISRPNWESWHYCK